MLFPDVPNDKTKALRKGMNFLRETDPQFYPMLEMDLEEQGSTPVGGQAPQFDLNAVLLNREEEPEFNAKKSRIFKILAGAGALGTILSPESAVGAVGQGLAAGGADAVSQMEADFLREQDRVRSMNMAIDQFNARQEQGVNEAQFDAEQAMLDDLRAQALESMKAENRQEQTRFETEENLRQKREEIEFLRSLPLTDKQRLELDAIEAQVFQRTQSGEASAALAENRRNNVGGFRPGKTPSIQSAPLMDLNLELGQLYQVLASSDATDPDYGISPSERIRVNQRIQEIRAEFNRRASGGSGNTGVGNVSGLPQSAVDAGFTAEEWEYLTPEQRAEFN